MSTISVNPSSPRGDTSAGRGVLDQADLAAAVNAYLMAETGIHEGNAEAKEEGAKQLAAIQGRFWRLVFGVLSAAIVRGRQSLDFTDDERLFMDLGLVDARMLGGDRAQTVRDLLEEINSKGMSGCYYLSEWLSYRQQQLQLESSLDGPDEAEDNYASQLVEMRRRVLTRLAPYLSGLPGIPLEVSESMRSGDLDNAVIVSGVNALVGSKRHAYLRRHNLWQLREQILAKARARTNSQSVLRLFEMLNEIYARDWRERYEAAVARVDERQTTVAAKPGGTSVVKDGATVSVAGNSSADQLMSEARQIRMRMVLMAAVDGIKGQDNVLHSGGPRVTKSGLAAFLTIPQTFDRALAELPPILVVPGVGRGFFAWETGYVMLALRPMVGLDDSVATAFAWQRMIDDRVNKGGVLRQAYEKRFPGAVFQNDFPADYRAWLCRLSKGDATAMNPQRRAFFRDFIGPDLSGPLLPPNLRNIGPQTMVAICRRLEKQLAADDNDVNLHRRLASLYWQQGNLEAAGLQFNAAMRQSPNDGETLFAAGMFMRAQGDGEAANDCFRYGAERASETLWGIYCRDALANQI